MSKNSLTSLYDKCSGNSFWRHLLLLSFGCAMLAGHFAWHQFAIGPEAALRLSEAQLIDGGAVPYVDFYDNATPFYIYLNWLPVIVAKIFSCHPILLFNELNVLFLFICGSALIMLGQVGERATAKRRNLVRRHGDAILFTLLFIVMIRLADFGSSLQFLFVAATPYIACRALRRRGLKIPRGLSALCALLLSLALFTDIFYLLGFALFEAAHLLGFAPYPRGRYLMRRYFGDELVLALAVVLTGLVGWWLIPSAGTALYLGTILPLYLQSFSELFGPLRYAGNGSDLRPAIYLTAFLLVVAGPFATRNVLSRLFAVASILCFAVMIAWCACLNYQSFGMVAFALLTAAATLPSADAKNASHAKNASRANIKGLATLLVALNILTATSVYLFERLTTDKGHIYALSQIGYWGQGDSHDLGPMTEALESFSQPKDRVGVVSLGVRPAYPSLTQMRRLPGFALTWGFPIITMDFLSAPMYQEQAARFAPFKQKILGRMAEELKDKTNGPKMVVVEEGQTASFLEQNGILKLIKDDYAESGSVPLFDTSESNEHQLKEFVGYKNTVSVFVRKSDK